MEVDGPNSVIMHTERAIKFVLDNPISEKIWPGATEIATRMVENTKKDRNTEDINNLTALTGVVYPGNDNNSNVYSSEEDAYSLPGTIGGNIYESIKQGMSLEEASSNSNMQSVVDQDAIAEEDRGKDWKGRSLTDTGNGRRLIDSFGRAIRYTPGLGWFVWSNGYWKPDAENLHMQEIAKKHKVDENVIKNALKNNEKIYYGTITDEDDDYFKVALCHTEIYYNSPEFAIIKEGEY
jgi:hypothetical protein